MCAKRRAPAHRPIDTAALTKATGIRQALPMTRLLIVAFALLTVACSLDTDATGHARAALHQQWQITLVAPESMRSIVASAGEEWNTALGREVFVMGTGSEAAGLKGHVYFRESSYEDMGGSGGHTVSDTGHHFDVLLTADMLDKRVAVLHELAHVLMGDGHSDDPTDLMAPDLAPEGAPITDAHVSAVYAFWGWDEQARDF